MSAKKSNDLFKYTTASSRRVMIAQDILKHIKAGRLKPTHRVWISKEFNDQKLIPDDIAGSEQVQTVFKKRKEPCRVCQLGAVCYAAITRFNNVTVGDLRSSGMVGNHEHGVGDVIIPTPSDNAILKRFFGKRQVMLMEFAFENGKGAAKYYDLIALKVSQAEIERTVAFREKATEGKPDARHPTLIIQAICKNIIANNGVFKP